MKKAAITIAAFAMMTSAAFGDILSKRDFPHQWRVSEHGTNGRATHCSLATSWEARSAEQRAEMRANSITLTVKMYENLVFEIGLDGDGWKLPPKKYAVEFSYDDRNNVDAYEAEPWLDMQGQPTSILAAALKFNGVFFDNLSGAGGFGLKINGSDLGTFSLAGSAAAIKGLMQCVSNLNAERADAGTFPGGPATGRGGGTF